VEFSLVLLAAPIGTQESNPDLAFTVKGTFASEAGEKLSFTSKPVLKSDVKHADFRIDKANGILILPGGVKGRKAAESLTEDAIDTLLASIREDETAS